MQTTLKLCSPVIMVAMVTVGVMWPPLTLAVAKTTGEEIVLSAPGMLHRSACQRCFSLSQRLITGRREEFECLRESHLRPPA